MCKSVSNVLNAALYLFTFKTDPGSQKQGALFIVFNYDFKIDPNPIKTQRGVNSICCEEMVKEEKKQNKSLWKYCR